MSVKINLLPAWRQQRLIIKNYLFYCYAIIAMLLALLIAAINFLYCSHNIALNRDNVNYLQAEINSLAPQIIKLHQAQETQELYLAKIAALDALQTNRAMLLEILDNIAQAIPDEVFLISLEYAHKSQATTVSIKGNSKSSHGISNFVQNLSCYNWVAYVFVNKLKNNISQHHIAFKLDIELKNAKNLP